MNLARHLKDYHLILASQSPRRQQFLQDLGLAYEIRLKSVEETYPPNLTGRAIAEYLAQHKAKPYLEELKTDDLLITGDTVVWFENRMLHKPKTEKEAFDMLSSLSRNCHKVISACCLTSLEKTVTVSAETKVYFKALTPGEINFYIQNFKPFDKAGGYGIQEWIGQIGIEKIEGSYYNVMGMPTAEVYAALQTF